MASIVFALIEWNQIVNMILNIDLAGRADKWNLLIDAFKKISDNRWRIFELYEGSIKGNIDRNI